MAVLPRGSRVSPLDPDDGDLKKPLALYKKCLAEFFATLFFVLIGCGTIQTVEFENGGVKASPQSVLNISLAHGVASYLLVSATGKISGGHLNPAVSFAIFLADYKDFPAAHLAGYVFSQLLGGIAGAAILMGIYPLDLLRATNFGAHGVAGQFTAGNGLLLEIFLTTVLVLVVLRTAVFEGQSTAPMSISIAVAIDHVMGIPVTGAGMNPARSFGPAIMANAWDDHWIYWLGPALGAAIGAGVYHILLRTSN